MRRLAILSFLSAAAISATNFAHADFMYMGGTHSFLPLTDSTTLVIPAGTKLTFPIDSHSKGEIRLTALMNALPEAKEQGHGFIIETDTDTVSLRLSTIASSDHIYEHDHLQFLLCSTAGRTQYVITLPATPDQYLLDKEPVLTLALCPAQERRTKAVLLGGRNQDALLWSSDTLPIHYDEISGIGFTAGAVSALTIHRAVLITPAPIPFALHHNDVEELLNNANDPYSGYWTILDYTLEDSMLRSGGEYTLALMPTTDDGYDIIYMAGATINPEEWTPGRIKGHLRPTRLAGLYRADWTDAEGRSLDSAATLQFLGTDIAQLTLPTLHSTLRLHRIRQ